MLHKWTVRGAPRLQLKGAQQRRDHFAGRALHDSTVKTLIVAVLLSTVSNTMSLFRIATSLAYFTASPAMITRPLDSVSSSRA